MNKENEENHSNKRRKLVEYDSDDEVYDSYDDWSSADNENGIKSTILTCFVPLQKSAELSGGSVLHQTLEKQIASLLTKEIDRINISWRSFYGLTKKS